MVDGEVMVCRDKGLTKREAFSMVVELKVARVGRGVKDPR